MSNKKVIELKEVSKTFKQKDKLIVALDQFSLEVLEGEIVSILGPSGCGKSTITKIIAGIESLDSGELIIDGVDCSTGVPKAIKQRIGYVFQWHNLAEWRTVLENLYLPLELFGMKKSPLWEERAKRYLNLVGLYDFRNIYPHELSGGMKQRVGLARALMNDPDMLVFDQPYGALDAITRKILSHSFSAAMREEHKSMLMITSNIEEAIRYSDQIYIMTSGPGRNKYTLTTNITPELRDTENFWLRKEPLRLKKTVLEIISDLSSDTTEEALNHEK
jgi:NitT/TauT family transport system ATP-binding protein